MYVGRKKKQLSEADKRSYYNQEEWLAEILDNQGAFYNGKEQPPEVFCKKRCY